MRRERLPSLTSGELLSIFKDVGGYLEGHFEFTSKLHGDVYLNKDAIYPHVLLISRICNEIAQRSVNYDFDLVIGPALGGIVLAHGVASYLTEMKGEEFMAIYTEKNKSDKQTLARGYDQLVRNKKVLIVEDVVTTGGSVMQVANCVKESGGEVAVIYSMVNRNPSGVNSETLGFPFHSLLEIEINSYNQQECPMCEEGMQIDTRVGKGKIK